jgi:hypothetical protein
MLGTLNIVIINSASSTGWKLLGTHLELVHQTGKMQYNQSPCDLLFVM